MLLLSVKKYPFSSQICFNKKFTRFHFPFKNLPLLQIIADIKTLLTPLSRDNTAISAILFAIFLGVDFLLLTSLRPPCKIILAGVSSIREGNIQYLRCFNVAPGDDVSFANEFYN